MCHVVLSVVLLFVVPSVVLSSVVLSVVCRSQAVVGPVVYYDGMVPVVVVCHHTWSSHNSSSKR